MTPGMWYFPVPQTNMNWTGQVGTPGTSNPGRSVVVFVPVRFDMGHRVRAAAMWTTVAPTGDQIYRLGLAASRASDPTLPGPLIADLGVFGPPWQTGLAMITFAPVMVEANTQYWLACGGERSSGTSGSYYSINQGNNNTVAGATPLTADWFGGVGVRQWGYAWDPRPGLPADVSSVDITGFTQPSGTSIQRFAFQVAPPGPASRGQR